jgi:hypothetical protein
MAYAAVQEPTALAWLEADAGSWSGPAGKSRGACVCQRGRIVARMTTTWVRRHANGTTALVVRVGETWNATVASGEFHELRETLEQARAAADELVGKMFPHDCAECPPWGHTGPGAQRRPNR